MRNIAIFGGTFNPVHWGHLRIAEVALRQAKLEQIIWVPTRHPPHKQQPMPTYSQRLEMVKRAIADNPAYIASDIDSRQKGTSYAIATLNDLQSQHPDTLWHWIIGIDAFKTLPQWHESKTLAEQCIWLVAPRQRSDQWEKRRNSKSSLLPISTHACLQLCQQVDATMGNALQWRLLQMPSIEISSSLIRHHCREGNSIHGLTPEWVRIYIKKYKLYT